MTVELQIQMQIPIPDISFFFFIYIRFDLIESTEIMSKTDTTWPTMQRRLGYFCRKMNVSHKICGA